MKKYICSIALLSLLASCGSNNTNTASADSSAEVKKDTTQTATGSDSTLLFDGKTLTGWHTYGKSGTGDAWSVQQSAIHLTPGTGDGDLVTDDEYENFDLQLDWTISKKGNSGIIFYINEDTTKYKETYVTGLEMQVLDNNGHPDAKIIKHRAGDLYDLITSKPESVKPAGEWNHVEIRADNGKLDFYLNGQHTLSTTLWDDNWKKLVAGSKFKDMPDFGTFKKGHIALQDHGNEVWYKNIVIKKL